MNTPKALALLTWIREDLGRPVRVASILDRFQITDRTFRRWLLDVEEAGFAVVDQGEGLARQIAIYRVTGKPGRRLRADPARPPADVIRDRVLIADRPGLVRLEPVEAGGEAGDQDDDGESLQGDRSDPLPPTGSTDPGVHLARGALAQEVRDRLAERLGRFPCVVDPDVATWRGSNGSDRRCRGTGQLPHGVLPPGVGRLARGDRAPCPGCPDCSPPCACGAEVPEARRRPAYAVPTCYACLPPPEPLPVAELRVGWDPGHPDGDRQGFRAVRVTGGPSFTVEDLERATLTGPPLIDQELGRLGKALGVPGHELPAEWARQVARLTWSRGLLGAWEALVADDGGPSAGCGVRLERGDGAAVARVVLLSPNGEELRELPLPAGRATLAGARAAVVEDLARRELERSGRSDGGS